MNIGYTIDIPLATHKPSVDQGPMQLNTNGINTWVDIDHYGFNDALGGYHDIIHQPPVVSSPVAIPNIGQTYVKTTSGDQKLYFKTGSNVEFDLTSTPTILTPAPLAVTNVFQTIVPSLPNSCIGFINMSVGGISIGQMAFNVISGTLYVPDTYITSANGSLFWQASGTAIQVRHSGGAGNDYTTTYRYMYWTV